MPSIQNDNSSKLISLHYYQLHKLNYLSNEKISRLNGVYLLLTCLNTFKVNKNDGNDIKLLHEYYFSFIVYLKLFIKIKYFQNLLVRYIFNHLLSLNSKYNHLIINNEQFKAYLLTLNLNVESLKQKLASKTSINHQAYLFSDYIKLKFQDYILHEMLRYLLNLKLFNKTDKFESLKLLYVQLIKSNNYDSSSLFITDTGSDDEMNKIKVQFILLQFLNMIYYWKFKKFNYKLTDMSGLASTSQNR